MSVLILGDDHAKVLETHLGHVSDFNLKNNTDTRYWLESIMNLVTSMIDGEYKAYVICLGYHDKERRLIDSNLQCIAEHLTKLDGSSVQVHTLNTSLRGDELLSRVDRISADIKRLLKK